MPGVDKTSPLPRYLQAKRILQDRITRGQYRPGGRLPGERDLAEDLRVSQMTVNKAVLALVDDGWLYRERGRGTFVREGFRPPLPAVLSLGAVVHVGGERPLEDFYLGSLFRGMQHAAMDEPVSLSLLHLPAEGLAERLLEANHDALLVVGPSDSDLPALRHVRREGRRVAMLGASWTDACLPFVDSDNRGGAEAAMEHLVSLRHRLIAGVFSLLDTCNTQDRMLAFRRVLDHHGLRIPSACVVTSGSEFPLSEEARRQVRATLRLKPRPTAYFCGGYFIALEVMRAIREDGLDVPGDVSVVGFDDPVSASHLNPPLTTVRQPLDQMGERTVHMLLQWTRTGEEPAHGVVLPTHLLVRGSSGPAPPSD
ncbi:MAG: GntR family transcriptional regulator [Chthonomonadales bacterium]|nr:GntR family transcriptional regulator [Chthonomonadales bacterium]